MGTLDERRFPPRESAGVLVVTAPDEWRLRGLLKRFDDVIRSESSAGGALPLEGRTLHVHVDSPGAFPPRATLSR